MCKGFLATALVQALVQAEHVALGSGCMHLHGSLCHAAPKPNARSPEPHAPEPKPLSTHNIKTVQKTPVNRMLPKSYKPQIPIKPCANETFLAPSALGRRSSCPRWAADGDSSLHGRSPKPNPNKGIQDYTNKTTMESLGGERSKGRQNMCTQASKRLRKSNQ